MLGDARQLADGTTLQADLCIVGAGAAGITLAHAFADTAHTVVLLEAGGGTADASARSIYRVEAGTDPRLGVDPTRQWYLGGSTNHWAGNCRPLDESDFEPRDWIPRSGWPFHRSELTPYYERAQAICGLSDPCWYDLERCRPHLRHLPVDVDGALANRVVHTCPQPSFAVLHGERLAAAANVSVWLQARAVRVATDSAGGRAAGVEAVTASGGRLRIEASHFVLASGGIENARVLLCSSAAERGGLAIDADQIGRCFMEHWYVDIALGDCPAAPDFDFYAVRQSIGSAQVWGQLVLSQEVARAEGVPGLCLWFQPLMPAHAASVLAARHLVAALRQRTRPATPIADAQLLLSDAGAVARHALRRLRDRGAEHAPHAGYALRVQLEQPPDPENRLCLADRCDRTGQKEVDLILRLPVSQQRAYARALQRGAAQLGLDGRRLSRQMEVMVRAHRYKFFWHHMGTTRMHDSAAQGVVDRDCRVHGVSNLFVAGSSVFPSSGSAPPTLTIVALALRLADHLRRGLDRAGYFTE